MYGPKFCRDPLYPNYVYILACFKCYYWVRFKLLIRVPTGILFSLLGCYTPYRYMCMSCYCFDLCVGTTKLGRPCQSDQLTWACTSCSRQLQFGSYHALLPGSVAVVLSSYMYMYI